MPETEKIYQKASGTPQWEITTNHLFRIQHIARRKEVKEEETGSGNSSIDSVNSGSGPDY
jgi:hypothetical protein